jgi:hypothetical protein
MTTIDEAAAWEARFQIWLSAQLHTYLASSPPPPDSTVAPEVAEWADNLEADGEARFAKIGMRRRLAAIR